MPSKRVVPTVGAEAPAGLRYGLAIVAAAAAVTVRLALSPILQERSPYTLSLIAVIAAAWYAGTRPAIVSVAVSAFGVWLLIIPHTPGAQHSHSPDWAQLGVFLVSSGVATAFGQRARRTRLEAEAGRARLGAVLQQMPAGVILRDAGGQLVIANAEAERLLGTVLLDGSPGSAAPYRMRTPEGRPYAPDEVPNRRSLVTGEIIRDEELIVEDATGRPRLLSVNSGPVRGPDGRIAGVIVSFTDLSERKRTETELAEHRERLGIALEAGRMGTFDWLLPENRVIWSPSLERMHGYQPGEFAGTSEAYFAEIHSEDRERVGGQVQEIFENRREHLLEYRIVRRDGAVLWVEGRGKVFRDDEGRPLRLVGVCTDITDRKHTEEAARRSQRLEAAGQLAAGMAHDTNNMMAAVLGYAHLVRRAPDLPGRLRRDLDEIIKAAERTANLTRQLLTFSRRQMVSPEVLDLSSAVRDTQDMLGRMLGSDIILELREDSRPCWVSIDRTQLVQIVLNLSLNARDAMPGGGRLTVLTRCDAPDDGPARVLLEVVDTGAGMTDAIRARIFEPFFTTKAVGQGTGLGLSTVHGIVIQAGGTIEVESEPGRGTRFRIAFPAAPALVEQPSAAKVLAPVRQSARLLLVDDEDAVLRLASRALQDGGYRVVAVSSGDAALQALHADGVFDALVTDLTMPGMNGRELAARAIRAHPLLPVLFVTGHHGAAPDMPGSTVSAVLQKPFSPESLAEAVERLLGEARAPSRTLGPG